MSVTSRRPLRPANMGTKKTPGNQQTENTEGVQTQTAKDSKFENDKSEAKSPFEDHSQSHIQGKYSSENRGRPEEGVKTEPQYSDDESDERVRSTRKTKEHRKLFRYYIVITFIVVPAFAYLAYCISKLQNEAIPSVPAYDIFKAEVDKLEQLFQGQDGEIWNIVQVSLEEIVYQPRPPKPAVLLIAYSSDGATTVECLEHKIAELAAKLLRSSINKIYISQLNLNDPHKAKLQLDKKLKQGFESGSRVLLIHDLHLLPAETALLLHGYADNENAPYKKAVIIFSCEIPSADSLKDGDSSSLDESLVKNELVNDHLKTLWEGYLGPSKAQALVSRVAWNTLFVHPEQEIPASCSGNLG